MRKIKASEIGTFMFCQRAHWFRRKGVDSDNIKEMEAGTKIHHQHSKAVAISSCSRTIAIILLLAGITLLTYSIIGLIF
jgi:CRISPR/Cas system-associated exonuclease Cas4 (RecB family)